MIIKDLLERRKNETKVFAKFNKKSISYNELYDFSKNSSEVILKKYKNFGSNIAIYLPNSIDYLKAYFTILFCNKIIVPIDTKTRSQELESILNYCEINLIVTNTVNLDLLQVALLDNDVNRKIQIINIDNIYYDDTIIDCANISCSNNVDTDDVVILLHTSGTTSDPKRVMLTNKNLISNVESNIISIGFSQDDIFLIALPMFFGYCNTAQILTCLYLGASLVIFDGIFFPKKFFEVVNSEKITTFTAVPTMLISLLTYRHSYKYDISSLKSICFGGGFISKKTINRLINGFENINFIQTYGQTECSPRVTALLPEYMLKKIGSVGQPIPNVSICIMDKNNKQLNSNEIGEICVRGDNVMKGYYKNSFETSRAIIGDWLHTGDLGYIDNDGFLFLTGRLKSLIISGGINIYPEEIEEIIKQFPCIKDVYVFGEYDDYLGEVPVAKIVVSQDVSEKEVRDYCVKNLTSYKVPKRFYFCQSIDKTYNGKTKRVK